MTDREKKQREILDKLHEDGWNEGRVNSSKPCYKVDQALSELSKLDAMPTSKEVEEVCIQILIAKRGCSEKSAHILWEGEGLGIEYREDVLRIAKSLLTKYSIGKR